MRKENLVYAGMSAVAVVILIIVVVVVANRYLAGKPSAGSTVKCSTTHTGHTVVIEDNQVEPQHTDAKTCDTLTIINRDTVDRLMAFGKHDDHIAYDGVSEQLLEENQQLTVTLNQPGTFLFHDHIHDEVQGTFTVQ